MQFVFFLRGSLIKLCLSHTKSNCVNVGCPPLSDLFPTNSNVGMQMALNIKNIVIQRKFR